MAISFPTSPTLGQIYTYNTVSYQWNGYAWDNIANQFSNLDGGTPTEIYVGLAPIDGGNP